MFGSQKLAIEAAVTHADHLLDKVITKRDSSSYDYYLKLYLTSFSARLVAVKRAFDNLPVDRRPPIHSLEQIANRINPFKVSAEPVVLHIKIKENGDHRLLMDFGVEHRALQYLLLPVLERTAMLHNSQFVMRGGVKAAISQVVKNLNRGFLHTSEIDIKSCFPSLEGEGLFDLLPFPRQVIRNVILAEHLNIVPGKSIFRVLGVAGSEATDSIRVADLLAEARRGIPHGSAISSIVAEILIAPTLPTASTESDVVSYADNVFTMGKTAKAELSTRLAVWSALKTHSVGPLQPKLQSLSSPAEAKRFLGHRLSLLPHGVKLTPSEQNEARFTKRMKKDIAFISSATTLPERKRRAVKAKGYLTGWCASFGLCEGMQQREIFWKTRISNICS